MAIAICPSCGEDIKLSGRPTLGQRVRCPHCDADLEVIDLEPLELDWVDYEEDWEEEEEWEEEDWEDEEDWDEEDWEEA